MALPNIYSKEVVKTLTARINSLTPETKPVWGKMNVAQMLAHCNVTYELSHENIHPKPKGLMKWMLKTFIKKVVTGEKRFKQNERTAPVFLVTSKQDFEKQRNRLIAYLNTVQGEGMEKFEGRENPGFGKLTAQEWNNLYYKHLDHHLTQFGV